MNTIPNLDEDPGNVLLEALLVTNLINQGLRGYYYDTPSG